MRSPEFDQPEYGFTRYSITGAIDEGYMLVLNPMTDRVESSMPFGPFETAEKALAFHDMHRAPELWKDQDRWQKSFKKGSPLEWMNPLQPAEREKPNSFGHGVVFMRHNLQIFSKTKLE